MASYSKTSANRVHFLQQGSKLFRDRVADFSDPHVELLERRGAIVIGKSNLPEFGAGANTYNE